MTTLPPTDHVHFFNYHTGRPRFHFDEAPPPAPPPAPPKAWHDGVDAEILGHWQNKGWKMDDAREIALAATRQAREAEKHFGVPVDRLLKLPDATAKPEDWAPIYQRLGAPKEAKEYDLTGITRAGKDLDPEFADALRASLAAAFVPKDKAKGIVEGFVKQLDSADAAQATIAAGNLATEKAALAQNWGTKFDFNHLQAMEGVRKAGITPEGVKAMEGQMGYAAVMEHFRKIGAGMSEAAFHEGSGDSTVNTRTGAIARLAELEADKGWGKKLTAGDATTVAEWRSLVALISGEAA